MAEHKLFQQVVQTDIVGLAGALAAKSDTGHDHDAAYSASGHNHDASYATAGHSHSAPLVPFAPQTFTDGTTITLNASLGTYFRGSLGGNRTLGVPSNGTDGQRLLVEALASGAQRTLTPSGSIVDVIGAGTITIPSGKRWFGGLVLSSGTYYLLASKVQP